MIIHISPILDGSEYEQLHLKAFELELNESERPFTRALQVQWDLFSKKVIT